MESNDGRAPVTVMVSGGFDPLHVGHLDMIEAAARYGRVIVVVNSDEWLVEKKGFNFMPHRERMRLVGALRDVSAVYPVNDWDGTVCEALARLRPVYFMNGGDRKTAHPKEAEICERLGIIQLFEGDKVQSSSSLVERARDHRKIPISG